MNCNKYFDLKYIINSSSTLPTCDNCGGTIKPDIVLYEKSLDMNVIDNSIKHICEAATLIVHRTSLFVYPAASLITYFKGVNLMLINKSSTDYDNKATLIINDNIGKVLNNISNINKIHSFYIGVYF